MRHKKLFQKITVWSVILSTILWSIGLPMFVPVAQAAITVNTQPTELVVSGQTIKASSDDTAIAKFTLTQNASETLSSVAITIVDIGSSGVAGSDIASLKVFKDDGDGVFNGADTLVGTQTTVNIGSPTTISTGTTAIAVTPTTFFITIATSATWSDATPADTIGITMAIDSITTSQNSPTVTALTGINTLMADTTAPAVLSVERMNPSAVVVEFSEPVFPSSAQTTGNYTFSGGLNVIDAIQEAPNRYRIVADGNITPGTTTLTVGSGVVDFAGNANSVITAQTVIAPIEIKISEVSAEMGSATQEFVELYNNGEAPTDISGWTIQYGDATLAGWTTIATIPASTNIASHSFYLIASSDYTAVSADTTLTPGMALVGGHIRLYNGSTEVDKVGWGTADTPETTAIGAHSANQSLERKAFGSSSATDMANGGSDANMGNGWDSGDNSFDFVVQISPNPQNSSSPTEVPDYSGFTGGGLMIMHMPLNIAPTGSALEVIAQMGDPMTPISSLNAELHYMVGDGSPTNNLITDYSVVMGTHQSNGYFKFTIPQIDVDNSTTNGLYYYLKVTSDSGSAYMSANPSADESGIEDQVAQNPFVVNVESGSGWTKHSISGNISDGSPVAGALVFLEGTGYNTTTDSSGNYTLSNIKDGNYNIIITKDGYYDEWIFDVFLNGANVTGQDKVLSAGTGGGMSGDNTKPFITWTGPPDGMLGVPPGDENFKVFIGVSKDLDSTAVNNSNVYLTTDGSTPIASTIVYDNDSTNNTIQGYPPDQYLIIVSPPTGGFVADTTYYLVISGVLRDTAGNALQGNSADGSYIFSFTTGSDFSGTTDWNSFGTGAMMPPYIAGTIPYDGSTDAVPNSKINITFSESMDSTSVNATNIKLYKVIYSSSAETTEEIPLSSVSLDTSQTIAILTPTSNLVTGKYRIVVSGALKSANGIWMGDPEQSQNTASYEIFRSSFEVLGGSSADTTAPTVLGTWPANNATGIAVNPGVITIQFSEGLDPASVNSNTVTLKRGSTKVNSVVRYDSMAQAISLFPSVVLATDTDYTLTVSGDPTATSTSITDIVGNPIASDSVTIFTTDSTGDTTAPEIMFANGDEYGVAITFSEAMNSAKITDSTNWATSVLNPANYIIKWGDSATVAVSGTVIDLSSIGATLKYDEMSNTVMIEKLGLTYLSGKDFYIDMTPANVSGTGVTDLSANTIANTTTFQMPMNSSADTMGVLGPTTNGMTGGSMGPDMGDMGMMKAGVFPMNSMAGQTTTYFVNIPTTKAIENNGQVVLTFPTGFDVSGAQKDTFSPVNDDVNEWNDGTITFSTASETSGGANNDGVTVNTSARIITTTLSVSGGTPPINDFLHLDIAGIVNSSIPRDFDTSGYTVDIKIMKADGSLSETVTGMPFFITAGGSATLSGAISGIQSADVDGTGDEVKVFLGSPMTGPMEAVATIANDGTGSYTFSNLPAGQYMIFTDPTITLDTHDYEGNPMPQPITLADGSNTKNITLTKAGTGSVATITVNITGSFSTDDIDVFAGGPTGFKVKTLSSAGTNPSATLYLPDGDWTVGMGPAMPKGPMAGPPPMPDWMPPQPVSVKVSSGGSVVTESSGTADDGTIALTVPNANIQIIGYVKDDSNNAIADAEVFAYQPMGVGMGSFTKTDTNGKFTLKISSVGTYSVGVHKQGLPNISDRTVIVKADGDLEGVGTNPADDGNDTADIEVNKSLIVDVNSDGIEDAGDNLFIFKITKPNNTISGKMTDGTNAVAYAPVWAYQQDGIGHADTMTDSSGNYILYVDNGSWVIQGYIPNYGDSESQTVVVSGSSVTQNISPDTTTTYYNISGTVTINGSAQTYMPIRAVKYDDNGNYTGQEYGGQTDSSGAYTISVPPGKYRVDIWTPDFGEVELTVADEVANSPANVIIANANKTGKDITIASGNLNTTTLAFTNGLSSQTGIVNIDGMSSGKPTGFHKTIKLDTLASNSSVELPDGDYMFFLDVPGVGFFEPTSNPTTISTDSTVTFVLPDSSTELFTISGQVTESGAGAVEGAWVWVGNPTTGNHTGATTDSSGNYSITIKTGTYKMGVEMPGYAPAPPTDITVSANTPNTDFVLNSADAFISGRIYSDANNNDSYDSGEEIANGWVRVEETTTKQIMGSPADVDGIFSIPVVNGTYLLKGVADGYSESDYGSPITVSGSDVSNKNIKLSVVSGWDAKLKSKPIAPASGGTLDDTASDGAGVKVVVPPNALGSESSNGQIQAKEVMSVSKTSSADPLGGKGKEITATDNSGQAITNLNDDVEVNLVYYKDDIELANVQDYDKLKKITNSYWDSSIGDWVPLSTTKLAYTKTSAGDTEWTTVTDFDAFVSALDTNPNTYADYKIETKSTVDHFTVFGLTTPTDSVAPSAPTGLVQSSGSGTSVAVDWDNNSEADLLEYEIYRSTSPGVTAINNNQVNTVQVATSAFTDSTATVWTSYYYTITAVDDSGNESTVASEVQMCSNSSVGNGTVAVNCTITCNSGYTQSGHSCVRSVIGGGGGAGSAGPSVSFCSSVVYGDWSECSGGLQTRDIISKSPNSCALTTVQASQKVRKCLTTSVKEINNTSTLKQTEPEKTEIKNKFTEKIITIENEADNVFQANVNVLLNRLGIKRDLAKEIVSVKKYVKTLIKNVSGLSAQSQNAINNFITYGTKTTRILGEGERAGVLNSYKSAFEKLPQTKKEWDDVIKIGNGRWPSETNEQTEKNAISAFQKVYLRVPNRSNPHDDAAVVVIAYGLRPSKRNLNSEKTAIRIFKAIYGYNPKSASAWDIVRAIAYSGATR